VLGIVHHQIRRHMRPPIPILISFAIVGVGIGMYLLPSSISSAPILPIVSFAGREPGLPIRSAGFYVTNSGHLAILLNLVQIQVAVDGGWKTLSEGQVQISRVLEAGTSQINISPLLESGDQRKIVVEWPEEPPWRVCITYSREEKGLKALTSKARFAWRTRSTSFLGARFWGRSEQVTSEEVAK
jgi:hypothetical protein